MTNLDTLSAAAAQAEQAYTTDQTTITSIQASIDTATAPLLPMETQLATDAVAFNASLDALSAGALAAKVPVPQATA
jgi:hypothetical protein